MNVSRTAHINRPVLALHSQPTFRRCATQRLVVSHNRTLAVASQRGQPLKCLPEGTKDVVSEDSENGVVVENGVNPEESGTAPEAKEEEYPAGTMVFTEPSGWEKFCTSFKLIFALPWRRFKKGSILSMQLEGTIQEVLPSAFSRATSLPAICDSLTKAAYDPRVSGLYIKIDPLDCGWAKLIEIRRHIEFFRQSGKFSVAYIERAGEKEFFLASACEEVYVPPSGSLYLRGLSVSGTFLRKVFEKVGVEPQIRRIGKYKSAGDQLLREDMSEPQKEQLAALLDDLYEGFVNAVASARGKDVNEIESFLDSAPVNMEQLVEHGVVTDLKYKDEIVDMLKERLGLKEKDKLRNVGVQKYSKVSQGAFGLGGKKVIAVIRASGTIVGGGGGAGSDSSIVAKKVIQEIKRAVEMKSVEAIVLRVDSPGGDALASDLMWREIKVAAKDKPIVASMGDLAASGGYYMSMAANKIVAEELTLTGSIGVVLAKFSLGDLYKRIGVGKEVLSKGRYAELFDESRGFTEEEDTYFSDLAQHAYESFRNKAAESRGLDVEEMQEVAQGRVWSGVRASKIGLVDALGGISRAIAIAKQSADIPQDEKVRILEISRQKGSPLEMLQGAGTISEAIGSLFLIVWGVGSLVVSGKWSWGELDSLLGVVFGASGLLGVLKQTREDPNWEYTMEDTEMNGSGGLQDFTPQAVMDDSMLASKQLSPVLKDVLKRLI